MYETEMKIIDWIPACEVDCSISSQTGGERVRWSKEKMETEG